MEKQKLFQYAVILHEKEEDSSKTAESYKSSKLVIEPTFLLAKDQKDVLFKVTRLIKDEDAKDPDNIEILVRNF